MRFLWFCKFHLIADLFVEEIQLNWIEKYTRMPARYVLSIVAVIRSLGFMADVIRFPLRIFFFTVRSVVKFVQILSVSKVPAVFLQVDRPSWKSVCMRVKSAELHSLSKFSDSTLQYECVGRVARMGTCTQTRRHMHVRTSSQCALDVQL